jgi:hypothetical protein
VPTTLVAVLSLLMLVLPGFIVAELAGSRRASRGGRSDLELVLRALWYSLVLHLAAATTGWTLAVYRDLDTPHEWERHVTAIAIYGLVVVVVAPTLLGLGLGAYLRRREQAGRLKGIDYALGASDSRHAWDYVFQHLDAGYVVVHLKALAGEPALRVDGLGEWRALVGTVGLHSWASQTPASRHDLYLQEARPATLDGRILGDFSPVRGVWIAQDEIGALFVLDPSFETTSLRSRLRRKLWSASGRSDAGSSAVEAPMAASAEAID